MAGYNARAFYVALSIWVGLFVLGLALRGAGVLHGQLKYMVFAFLLGAGVIVLHFRGPESW